MPFLIKDVLEKLGLQDRLRVAGDVIQTSVTAEGGEQYVKFYAGLPRDTPRLAGDLFATIQFITPHGMPLPAPLSDHAGCISLWLIRTENPETCDLPIMLNNGRAVRPSHLGGMDDVLTGMSQCISAVLRGEMPDFMGSFPKARNVVVSKRPRQSNLDA